MKCLGIGARCRCKISYTQAWRQGPHRQCQPKVHGVLTGARWPLAMAKAPNPFRWFDSSPEAIRLCIGFEAGPRPSRAIALN